MIELVANARGSSVHEHNTDWQIPGGNAQYWLPGRNAVHDVAWTTRMHKSQRVGLTVQ
jgi:hypothetical protein